MGVHLVDLASLLTKLKTKEMSAPPEPGNTSP
jgi:hypothetical protein